MEKPNLRNTNPLPAMRVQPYERYLPSAFDNSLSILEKINKMIHQMNIIGESTNGVIEQWNELMNWIVGNGLEKIVSEIIEEKISDGTFDRLFDTIVGNLSNLTTQDKATVVNAINELVIEIDENRVEILANKTNIGDILNLETGDKTNLVNAINEVHNATVINRQAPTTIGEATGYGTISGFRVRQQAVPSMAVEVGEIGIDNIVHMPSGIRYLIPSVTIPVEPASATLNRIDMVYVDSTGTITIRKGTPSNTPTPPNYQGEEVPLAYVNVLANDTSVNDSDIVDKRPFKNLDMLITDNKQNFVLAINEVFNALVQIKNELLNDINNLSDEVAIKTGELNNLTTTDKTNLVSAINELNTDIDEADNAINQNTVNIGDIALLPTENKSSIVNSILEVVQKMGDIDNLTSNDKTNLVNAVNSVSVNVDANRKSITDIYYNVEDYGAIPDGITDSSQAINDAIADCVANGGGTIFFPRTYAIFTTIVKPAKVNFIGINFMKSGLIWRGGNATSMVSTVNQSLHGTIIENMHFTNGTSQTNVTGILGGSTLEIYNSAIGVFRNLFFSKLRAGVAGNAEPDGVGIFDCLFDNIWCAECDTGLWLFGSGNVIIHPRIVLCDSGVVYDYLNPESYTSAQMIGGVFVQNNYDIGVPNVNGIRPSSFNGTWFEQARYGIVNIPNLNTRVMSLLFQSCMLNTNSNVDLISFYGAWGAITIDTCTISQSVNGAKNIVRPISNKSSMSVRNSFLINLDGTTEIIDDDSAKQVQTFVRVTKTENQVITKDVFTNVSFPNPSVDTLVEFNHGENWFSPKNKGVYNIVCNLQIENALDVSNQYNHVQLVVYHNGQLYSKLGDAFKEANSPNLIFGVNGSINMQLNPADVVQIYLTTKNDVNILSSNVSSYLNIARIQ